MESEFNQLQVLDNRKRNNKNGHSGEDDNEEKYWFEQILNEHPYCDDALARIVEVTQWLDDQPSDVQRKEQQWELAYNLVPWESYPGDNPNVGGVVLQNLSGGLVGSGGGPTELARRNSASIRMAFDDNRQERGLLGEGTGAAEPGVVFVSPAAAKGEGGGGAAEA